MTGRQVKILLASLLSLAVVSSIDYWTGYEFLFFVFYFIPVAICGWLLGWGSTLAMAVLCGASWFWVDRLAGHHYPHEAYRYWNSFICLVAFAIIGLVLHYLRRVLREEHRVEAELRATLAELQRSTEEIRRLQSELQVVCAWTQRIRVKDQWIPLDKFLADRLHLSISHGVSPEALEQLKKALAQEPPAQSSVAKQGISSPQTGAGP